jgi:hypothetical protein
VLFNADVLAHLTSFLLVFFSLARFHEHLPTHQQLATVKMGPDHPLFSMWFLSTLAVATTAAALVLMFSRPQTYFRYRTQVCLALRLHRLWVHASTLWTPAAAGTLAMVVAARVRDHPHKAPAMMIIQPVVYYMQPAMLLLPLQYVVVLQVLVTAAVLHYLWQFPCYLNLVMPDLSTHVWQQRAELSCSKLQSYATLLTSAYTGWAPVSPNVCQGTSAVQALQIYGAILCLVLGPIAVTYEWERWLRLRHGPLHNEQVPVSSASSHSSSAGGVQDVGSSSSSSHTTSSSSRSGGATTHAGASSSMQTATNRWPPLQHPHRTSPSVQSLPSAPTDAAVTSTSPGSEIGHVVLLLLVVVLLLPVLWTLTELLAEVFDARRDCQALLPPAAAMH